MSKYGRYFIRILVVAGILVAGGYHFLQTTNQYDDKVKPRGADIDGDHESPSYLIVLPDDIDLSVEEDTKEVDEFEQKPEPIEVAPVEKEVEVQELIENVPNVNKLDSKNLGAQMKNVASLVELTEKLKDGLLLPKISDDGKKPWIEYSSETEVFPYKKKVAIIFSNLGFDKNLVRKMALVFLSEVSMSLSPYGTNVEENILEMRKRGHETYADVLLSPKDYLREDAGPLALNFDLAKEEVLWRFHKNIAKTGAIGGIIVRDGKLEKRSYPIIKELLSEVKNRGLLMVDATMSHKLSSLKVDGLARVAADVVLNRDMSAKEIDRQIKQAEVIAKEKGQVLVVADAKPLIIVKLSQWVGSFTPSDENNPGGFALVPVSKMVKE